jgi:hypothetical protein
LQEENKSSSTDEYRENEQEKQTDIPLLSVVFDYVYFQNA